MTETLTHAHTQFPLASTLGYTLRLICVTMCLSRLTSVCKMVNIMQSGNMQFEEMRTQNSQRKTPISDAKIGASEEGPNEGQVYCILPCGMNEL
jgi:hypothetical protein